MKIFVSYCDDGQGLNYARKSKTICKQKNIETWVWKDDARSTQYLATDIADNIKSSDAILTIVTEGTSASDGQKNEWSLAASWGRINSSIRIKGLDIPSELRARPCLEFTVADFDKICARAIEELEKAIAGIPVSNTPVSISLSPVSGLGAITIEGSKFSPSSSIIIQWGSKKLPTVPMNISADMNGNFTAIVSVPVLTPGEYTIMAKDSSAEARTAVAKFMVPAISHAGPAGPAGPPGPQGPAGKSGPAVPLIPADHLLRFYSTKSRSLNIDGSVVGGCVGSQIEIFSSINAWVDANNKRWNRYTQLLVTLAGSPIIITDEHGNPVSLITDSEGLIPSGVFYFRVPLAIRGRNQLIISGQGLSHGQIVINSKVITFFISTGIGVTRGTNPLPDWSKSAEKVGKQIIVYGTCFGINGIDSGIVITWDGLVIASGISSDSYGRWQVTVKIPPQSVPGPHTIEAITQVHH